MTMAADATITPTPTIAEAPATSKLTAIRDLTKATFNMPDEDTLAVDYVVALLVSNTWTPDADPLWGWLVGPPGSCKTELVRPLQDFDKVHFLSSLTACALVSGYDKNEDGTDVSLLPKLKNKVLVIKDFTAILSQPQASLMQIFGDLRDAYDGSYGKHFGTVGERSYKVKFGVLAAVTPAIDDLALQQTMLGERFLTLRICRSALDTTVARIRYLVHVRNAMSSKAVWRKALADCWQSNMAAILKNLPDTVAIPEEFDLAIIHSADLLSRLRHLPDLTPDKYTPEKEHELGSRLVNQLANLAMARCAADGRQAVNAGDLALVSRVTWDSMPPISRRVLRAVYRAADKATKFRHINDISKDTHIPVKVLKSVLECFKASGIVEAADAEGKVGYTSPYQAEWRLTPSTLEQVQQARLFTT
jgi:hypothetical protein